MSERQSCSTWMWDESKDLWDAIRAHPFITELKAGTLPDSKLKFYFEQNIQYIDAVYKTRLVAASKTDDRQTFDLLTRDWSLEPSVDRQPRLLGLFGGDADRLPPDGPGVPRVHVPHVDERRDGRYRGLDGQLHRLPMDIRPDRHRHR